jgi:WD40 repeat protein
VTADAGAQDGEDANAGTEDEPLVIIWNAQTATPIRTLSLPAGICALELSADASLLAVTTTAQQLYIYHWATTDTPLAQHTIPCADVQICVRFHPSDPTLLVSNGQSTVIFWHLFPTLFPYIPPLASKDFRHPVGKFTQSTFLPSNTAPSPLSPNAPRAASVRTTAASATMDGDVVVWDVPAFDENDRNSSKFSPSLSSLSPSLSLLPFYIYFEY